LSTFTPRPQMLDVSLQTHDGRTLQLTNPQGFTSLFNSGLWDYTDDRWLQEALIFGNNWTFVPNWSVDWGARYEHVRVTGENTGGATNVPANNGNPNNIFDSVYPVLGPNVPVDRTINTLSYSGAISHEFSRSNSVYARYSLAKKSPDLYFYAGL